jgi:hypothetical protein
MEESTSYQNGNEQLAVDLKKILGQLGIRVIDSPLLAVAGHRGHNVHHTRVAGSSGYFRLEKYIISAISMVNCGSGQIIIICIEHPQFQLDVRDNLVLEIPQLKLALSTSVLRSAQALIDFYVCGFWSLQKNYWTEKKITICCLD